MSQSQTCACVWKDGEVVNICGAHSAFMQKVDEGLPIPMLLTCPLCGARHIDKGEFATKPHHTHACQGCGLLWKPALVSTLGVQYLPGCKNPEIVIVSAPGVGDHGD